MTHDQELLAAAKENLALRVSVHSAEEIVSNIRLRKAIENCEQAAKREPVVTAQMMKQAADAWCEWFGCDNDDSQRPSGTFFLHILTKALTTPRGG